MIKDLAPPTEAEEYGNVAEILRDLAAQVRFGKIRDEIVDFADNLDRLRRICRTPIRTKVRSILGAPYNANCRYLVA
jgi:hypothetical protein